MRILRILLFSKSHIAPYKETLQNTTIGISRTDRYAYIYCILICTYKRIRLLFSFLKSPFPISTPSLGLFFVSCTFSLCMALYAHLRLCNRKILCCTLNNAMLNVCVCFIFTLYYVFTSTTIHPQSHNNRSTPHLSTKLHQHCTDMALWHCTENIMMMMENKLSFKLLCYYYCSGLDLEFWIRPLLLNCIEKCISNEKVPFLLLKTIGPDQGSISVSIEFLVYERMMMMIPS